MDTNFHPVDWYVTPYLHTERVFFIASSRVGHPRFVNYLQEHNLFPGENPRPSFGQRRTVNGSSYHFPQTSQNGRINGRETFFLSWLTLRSHC